MYSSAFFLNLSGISTPVALKSSEIFNYLDNKSFKGNLGDGYMSLLESTRCITPVVLELAGCQRAHWKMIRKHVREYREAPRQGQPVCRPLKVNHTGTGQTHQSAL